MKVCIIGKGLTSLTLAKALVNRDIFVDIIYKKNHRKIDQTRTLGISKSNIEYFNEYISNIDKLLWKISKIKIFSESLNNNEIIKFEDKNLNLFSIVQNQKILKKLKFELKKSKFFHYRKEKNLNDFRYDEYNLIINCEANNEITKKYFSYKIEKKYNSVAYTTIIDHKKLVSNNTAFQIFTKKGPLAFLPISKTKTSVVYSHKQYDAQNKLDINGVIKKFNSNYEIKKINEISLLSLKSINLRKYYAGNILAFGDLLHKVHPLAGQGFNMSIRDIKDLIKIIDNKIQLGLPIDKSVCEEFQKRTLSKNYIFSSGIDFIYEFFNFENKTQSNFGSSTVKLIGKNKILNNYFKKFADIGLGI
jgi:2-octaprenyl-6-methoxyphenol hydroxylase